LLICIFFAKNKTHVEATASLCDILKFKFIFFKFRNWAALYYFRILAIVGKVLCYIIPKQNI